MKTALYAPEEKANANHALAHRCKDQRLPLTFLNLQGSQEDETFVFSSARKGMRMIEATQPASAERIKQLTNHAEEWLQSDNTQAFVQKEFVAKDYSAERAFETNCKLFSLLSRHKSGIPALDEKETFWQMNWVRVHEPSPGDTVTTTDGERLWPLVTVRDQTHHYSFRMTEKAALRLSSHDNAADFKAAHEAGTLWFPILCSLKLIRKCTDVKPDSGVASSAGQPTYMHEFDSHIVDASEQSLTEPPTMESLFLIDLLASKLDSVDTFLPAALHMIHKSVHYSMVVNYAPQDLVTELSHELAPAPSPDTTLARACFQAFALVEATTKSEMVELDGQGYKLITKGVKDALAPDSPTTYTLTAFCTLSNLQDFKLDPPRGTKTTTAFVVISDILPGAGGDEPMNFIVDSILQAPRDDVPKVAAAMKKCSTTLRARCRRTHANAYAHGTKVSHQQKR